MSDNDNDLGAFLAGFVIGGLVGAATALILAPQSGEEMRGQLAAKSRELRQTGEEQMQRYRQLADDYSQDYREKADQLISETRNRVEDASGRVQEQARIVLDAGKDRVAQVAGQEVDAEISDVEGETGKTAEDDTVVDA
jgi:gas vesicle protein